MRQPPCDTSCAVCLIKVDPFSECGTTVLAREILTSQHPSIATFAFAIETLIYTLEYGTETLVSIDIEDIGHVLGGWKHSWNMHPEGLVMVDGDGAT